VFENVQLDTFWGKTENAQQTGIVAVDAATAIVYLSVAENFTTSDKNNHIVN